jgi:hypothetical protein
MNLTVLCLVINITVCNLESVKSHLEMVNKNSFYFIESRQSIDLINNSNIYDSVKSHLETVNNNIIKK